MTTTRQRFTRGLAATALVGLAVPVVTLAGAPAAVAEEPGYSGFSTQSSATPVKIEIYEPTIPIPATPQAELSFGYSKVEADTGSSVGRASYLWPGDSLGEGAKTVIDQLGLPKEIGGPLGEQGYPFQVNSAYPSDQESEKDEPFPGMVMRTSAAADRTAAQTGYSTDCQVEPSAPEGDGGDAPEGPSLPEVPGLPSGLGIPGLTGGGDGEQASTERRIPSKKARAKAEEEASCQIPAELASLIDFGGYVSTTESTNDGETVSTVSRSALSDVQLLGGAVTLSGISSRTKAASDGTSGDPGAVARYGTLTIGDQEFAVGPGGVEGGGEGQEIPGLPDDPEKALAQLGLTITVPKPKTQRAGDEAVSTVRGLVVEIDSSKVRSMLDDVPFDDLVDLVPDETGQLKSLIGAAVHLSPRFVITLGGATSAVDTVDPITVPTVTPTDTGEAGGVAGGGSSAPAAAAAPAGAASPGAAASAPGRAPATGALTGAQNMGNGLPPLKSIPGALTLGGIIAAAAAGSWLRKIGALALGGAGTCPHGLDSGLPDLRKA